MSAGEQSLNIIGNESNMVYEMEPGSNSPVQKPPAPSDEGKTGEQPSWNVAQDTTPQSSNDLATNDGGVIDTLDTAFHGKPGVAEGTNPSGSSRADYYEQRPYGQSDAAEEWHR
jgi:hypothetical protein